MSNRIPPWYVVKVAFGRYVVGQKIQPLGIYKDKLIRAKWIEIAPITLPDPEPAPVVVAPAVSAAPIPRDIKTYHTRGRR